jgi:uncharacterized protein
MRNNIRLLALIGLSFLSLIVGPRNGEAYAAEPIRALIIDGQNNHVAWPKTTMMMKKYLEDTKRYTVDIARTKYTWKGDELLAKYPLNDGVEREALNQARPDPNFKPDFSKYQVVISNFGFGAAKWPDETNTAFEKFVADGGGLVIIHAADNSFGDWNEYNSMIGLGGWGGRNEKSGPYVFLNEQGERVEDTSKGSGGSHGDQHEFAVVVRDSKHPIMDGLPKIWMHTKDELYDRLRGPGTNMKILATAFASTDHKGSGRHEPMVMTIDYKKGRVFHTPLGHADYSMECVGFITLFVRGTDWAATGRVIDSAVPQDFPTAEKSSKRTFD